MPTNIPTAFAGASEFLLPAEWQALSDILDPASAGMLFLRDGIILHLSDRLAGLLGFDNAELVGQPVEPFLLAACADALQIRLTSKSGQPITFQRTIQNIETPDGEHATVWVLKSATHSGQHADDGRWLTVVEHLPEPTLISGPDTRLAYANKAFRALLDSQDTAPDSIRLLDLVHREDQQKLMHALNQASGASGPPVIFRIRDRNHSWRHLEAHVRELPPQAGGGLLLTARDVTGQFRQQREAAAGKKRQLHYMNRLFQLARQPHANFASTLKTILKASAKALGADRCAYWEFDEDPAATRCIMAYDDLRQSLVDEEIDPLFATSFHPLLHKVVLSEHAFIAENVDCNPRAALSCEYFHAAGIKALLVVPVMHIGHKAGLLILSESRQACAWGDDEAAFVQHAGELIAQTVDGVEHARSEASSSAPAAAGAPAPLSEPAEVPPPAFAAFSIDLENIGHVSESLGQAAGDELLEAAALRLKNVARKDDILLRPDNTAFMLLARGLSDPHAAADIARQLDETMRDLFVLQGCELRISASVDVALYPSGGPDIDTLMRKAVQRGVHMSRPAATTPSSAPVGT